MKQIIWSSLSDNERADMLERPAIKGDANIPERVRNIVNDVRQRGDVALSEYTQKFDGAEITDFSVTAEEIKHAGQTIHDNAATAIRQAYDNIYRFHEAQGFRPYQTETLAGVSCARIVRPVEAAGLYVPGGSAPLISTTLMIGIPSQIAGCVRRILCTPCDSTGKINPHILFAASLCGIENIYRLGGAQAIAAMAYGTKTIPAVDKIFGPGNAYVTAAKQLVAEDAAGAAQDMPAGPSEVCVISDETTNPVFAAADLLSQAEHDTMSQGVLITVSRDKAQKIQGEIARQIETLPRRNIAAKAIANSISIVVNTMAEAINVANLYAPEHLIMCFEDAAQYVDDVQNAGSVFVGPWSTESAGDYCSGTNHVLPTYGSARCYSGLGVEAFQKTLTVQTISKNGLMQLSDTIDTLAGLEGLDAHARTVSLRLGT